MRVDFLLLGIGVPKLCFVTVQNESNLILHKAEIHEFDHKPRNFPKRRGCSKLNIPKIKGNIVFVLMKIKGNNNFSS